MSKCILVNEALSDNVETGHFTVHINLMAKF